MKDVKGEFKTFSGLKINLLAPTPEMINIEDIAVGLSRECRWMNQSRKFHSVAEHSVIIAGLVSKEVAREALLHDAAEAYLRDLAKPIKMLIPDYCEIENRLAAVIAEKFGLTYPWPAEIKKVEMELRPAEFEYLMHRPHEPGYKLHHTTFRCYAPEVAQDKFMEEYHKIFNV